MYTPKKPNFIIATIPLLSLIFMAFMSTVYWGIGMLCFVNFFPAKRAPKIQPGEHGFQPCELRVRYGERAYPCRAADGNLSAALTFVVTTSLDGPQSGLSAFRSPPAGAGSEFRGDRGRTGIGRLMRSRSGRRDCFGAGWFQLRRGRFRIVGRARRC